MSDSDWVFDEEAEVQAESAANGVGWRHQFQYRGLNLSTYVLIDILEATNIVAIPMPRKISLSINYRHPLTIAIAATAAACVVILIALVGWKAYANRAMRKHYPIIDLPAIGIKTGLRTERVGRSVEYVFFAKPESDALRGRFSEVMQRRNRENLQFFVTLEDDDGFKLCETRASWNPDVDNQGSITWIRGNGVIPDCPISLYARASKWTIHFRYPLVSENLLPQPAQSQPQKTTHEERNTQQKPEEKKRAVDQKDRAISILSIDDKLTGANPFSGEIETLSGRSFKVNREAEKSTLVTWMSPEGLAISCRGASCLITNEDRGQSVHANLIR